MQKADTLADQIQRVMNMLNDGADVHFLVGGEGTEKERLSAHKSILCSVSEVFEAMFRFDAENAKAENVIDSVVVTDVEAGAFNAMLSFIYAGDLSGLNGDTLFPLLYAAKKYNIVGLHKACLAFPFSKLPNVFHALVEARLFGEEDFARRCLSYIDANASTLIESEAFLQIDQNLLCEILGRHDQLMIGGQIAIWNAALSRWADAQCRQNSKECSAENRRAVLGPVLNKVGSSGDKNEVFCSLI